MSYLEVAFTLFIPFLGYVLKSAVICSYNLFYNLEQGTKGCIVL